MITIKTQILVITFLSISVYVSGASSIKNVDAAKSFKELQIFMNNNPDNSANTDVLVLKKSLLLTEASAEELFWIQSIMHHCLDTYDIEKIKESCDLYTKIVKQNQHVLSGNQALAFRKKHALKLCAYYNAINDLLKTEFKEDRKIYSNVPLPTGVEGYPGMAPEKIKDIKQREKYLSLIQQNIENIKYVNKRNNIIKLQSYIEREIKLFFCHAYTGSSKDLLEVEGVFNKSNDQLLTLIIKKLQNKISILDLMRTKG